MGLSIFLKDKDKIITIIQIIICCNRYGGRAALNLNHILGSKSKGLVTSSNHFLIPSNYWNFFAVSLIWSLNFTRDLWISEISNKCGVFSAICAQNYLQFIYKVYCGNTICSFILLIRYKSCRKVNISNDFFGGFLNKFVCEFHLFW